MLKSLLGVFFFSFTNGLNLVPKNMVHKFSSFESGEKIIKNNPNKLNADSSRVYETFLNYPLGINGCEFNFNEIEFLNSVRSNHILNFSNKGIYSEEFSYVFSIYGLGTFARSYYKGTSQTLVNTYKGFSIKWNIVNNDITIYGENVYGVGYDSSTDTYDDYYYENDLDNDNIIYARRNGEVVYNLLNDYSFRGYFLQTDTLKCAIGVSYYISNAQHNVPFYVFNYSDSQNAYIPSYSISGSTFFNEGYFNFINYYSSVLPISYSPYSLSSAFNFSMFYSSGKYAPFGVCDLNDFLSNTSYTNAEKLERLNNITYANIWNSNNAFLVNDKVYDSLCLHFAPVDETTYFAIRDDEGNIIKSTYITANTRYVYIDYVYACRSAYPNSTQFVICNTYGIYITYQNINQFCYFANMQNLNNSVYRFGLLFYGTGFDKNTNGFAYTAVDILGLSINKNEGGVNYGGSIFDGITLINTTFENVTPLLDINILPGLTIGVLLFLPLVASIIVLVFKMLNK